jgi:hypothetical protein
LGHTDVDHEADRALGYGMVGERLIHVSDVSRGRACGAVCVACGGILVAKKGAVRKHHFAHFAGVACTGAPETVLHILAKELVSELDQITLPAYLFVIERATGRGVAARREKTVARGGVARIDRVDVERPLAGFVPDLLITSRDRRLVVEIGVTHFVDRRKMRSIRRNSEPAIEIRLGLGDALLTRDALREKLRDDVSSKSWLFHPAQRKVEADCLAAYRALSRDERSMWRRQRGAAALRDSAADVASRDRSAARPAFPRRPGDGESAYQHKFDEAGEAFYRQYGRYPTIDECLTLYPWMRKRR